MAFGIGINTEHPEHNQPKGEFHEAAVKCWFTAKGVSKPLMMKVQTEQGEIVAIEDIHVLTSEKQWYAGIMTVKYRCQAEVDGIIKEFVLLFRPDECTWKIVF